MRLAIYNYSMFRLPASDPANDGFHARNDGNFRAAEQAVGFVARSGHDGEPGPESWGVQVYPRFHVERGDGWAPSTLSLWDGPASLMAFAYTGIHAEAMRHGGTWFVEREWPAYVLWWVEPARIPDWSEGVERFEYLHDHGPGPRAFTFQAPYDPAGAPATIDRAEVKAKMAMNRARQAPSV